MSLMEQMMTPCVLLEKTRIPDKEGGFDTKWVDGVSILAAITLDTTVQATIAESRGVASTYTVTTSRAIKLEYNDILRRESDGKIFRVTSDAGDKVSPDCSTLDMAQVTAEKWELTT